MFVTGVRVIVAFIGRKTVNLVQRAERAGVEWITVHGRTVKQRTEPVDYDAIRQVRDLMRSVYGAQCVCVCGGGGGHAHVCVCVF